MSKPVKSSQVAPRKKRKLHTSPTRLTIAYLKARGITARVTEKWVKAPAMPQGGYRLDLFGGDLMAILNKTILNVQAGAAVDHNKKVIAALANPVVRLYLETGNPFHVWTWRQVPRTLKSGKRGKKDKWVPRATEIYCEDKIMKSREFIFNE